MVTHCLIWEEYSASGQMIMERTIVNSARAGGGYSLIETDVALQDLAEDVRARLTTTLVDQRAYPDDIPEITVDLVNDAKNTRPLKTSVRAARLLRLLADRTTKVGDVIVNDDPLFAKMMAWSESTTPEEVEFLLEYLQSCGWIRCLNMVAGIAQEQVTISGYEEVGSQDTRPDPSLGFVAMWFDDEMRELYRKGIAPAIEAAGYRPDRMDERLDVHNIDDATMAAIRRSRFVVADFTHGPGTVRGSVYYEAGFAEGLGVPVIYTCRRNQLDKLLFDTRQISHLGWDEPSDLYEGLRLRIEARFGEGPLASRRAVL